MLICEPVLIVIQDTVVRWSAAKGVARISDRLPWDFTEQVLETIMGHFSTHSIAVASIYDMPAIAESTWHGACLACAEMARRGLVSKAQLSTLVDWLCKVRLTYVFVIFASNMSARLCILTSERDLIPLDRASETLPRMCFGL